MWQPEHGAAPKSKPLVATGFLCARLDVVSRLSWSGGFDGQINERGLREIVSEGCRVGFSCKAWSVAGVPAEPCGDRAPAPTPASEWDSGKLCRERAKAKGVVMGRKPKLTDHQRQEAIARREAGESLVDIGRSYNVSHSTISRL